MIKILKSSSKGNCIVIEKNDTITLLDLGLKYKELKKLIDINKLKNVVVTHLHNDHSLGIWSLYKNKKVDLILNNSTKEKIENEKNMKLNCEVYSNFDTINKENFNFQFFKINHDVENYAILVNEKILYITDTGYIPYYFELKFFRIEHLIIESNHDVETLKNCDYIDKIKLRSNSTSGHLNNQQTYDFIKKIKPKNIYLTHISSKANDINILKKMYENMKNVLIFEE